MGGDGWRRVGADWREVVLVCRKCSKKIDGGFGPDRDEGLAKALRRGFAAGEARKRKARRRPLAVLEVGCLGVCPKRAVVVVKASEPGALVLVPQGAGFGEVVARLGLGGFADPGREDAAGRPASPDSAGGVVRGPGGAAGAEGSAIMGELRAEVMGGDKVAVTHGATGTRWDFAIVKDGAGRRHLDGPQGPGEAPGGDLLRQACVLAQAEALHAGHIDY